MDSGEFVAVLVTETVPVKLPTVIGAKVTLKLAVWPAARFTGVVRPLTLK
jgi:hypothetical protein